MFSGFHTDVFHQLCLNSVMSTLWVWKSSPLSTKLLCKLVKLNLIYLPPIHNQLCLHYQHKLFFSIKYNLLFNLSLICIQIKTNDMVPHITIFQTSAASCRTSTSAGKIRGIKANTQTSHQWAFEILWLQLWGGSYVILLYFIVSVCDTVL